MQQVHADNNRNESQITFISDDSSAYGSPDDFYAAAIRVLWAGWDSDANTEKYIANANKQDLTREGLQQVVAECLQITPVADFELDFANVVSVHSFRDDWNVREYVWSTPTTYWLMCWDTSA